MVGSQSVDSHSRGWRWGVRVHHDVVLGRACLTPGWTPAIGSSMPKGKAVEAQVVRFEVVATLGNRHAVVFRAEVEWMLSRLAEQTLIFESVHRSRDVDGCSVPLWLVIFLLKLWLMRAVGRN